MFTRVPRFSPIRAASGVTLSLLVLSAGVLAARAQEQPAAPGAAPAAAAPSVQILTLDEAIKYGLERQPAVAAARATLNAAVVAREATYSPLSVLGGPMITVRRKQADLGVQIAQANLDEAELNTVHAVTRTYLTVIYAQDQLKVAQEFSDRMARLRDTTKRALDAGSRHVKAADLDEIDSYANFAQAKAVEARHGISRAKAALREAIGAPADCHIDFATDTLDNYYQAVQRYFGKHGADFGCCCCVDAAVSKRPELAQAALLANIVHLEVDAQNLSFCAYVRTFAAYADIHSKVLPSTIINDEYRPGVLAQEMPVYLAGHRHSRVNQAYHLAERASIIRDKIRGLIALETEDACLRLASEGAQVGLLRVAADKAEKTVEHGKAAYRAQQGGIDNWLEAEGVTARARGQLNEALYKYASALASLQKATAGKLWSCLEKPAQPAPAGETKPLPK